jgi:hypothetical protein
MAGMPTTAGTCTWTMRVTDYNGQQATTQQFTITIPRRRARRCGQSYSTHSAVSSTGGPAYLLPSAPWRPAAR